MTTQNYKLTFVVTESKYGIKVIKSVDDNLHAESYLIKYSDCDGYIVSALENTTAISLDDLQEIHSYMKNFTGDENIIGSALMAVNL